MCLPRKDGIRFFVSEWIQNPQMKDPTRSQEEGHCCQRKMNLQRIDSSQENRYLSEKAKAYTENGSIKNMNMQERQ